jgi:hypothetical protein
MWTDLDVVDKLVRSIGGPGFALDRPHSQCEPDQRIAKSFVTAADPGKSSLRHQDYAAIAKHRAVAYILAPATLAEQAPVVATRMIAVIAALLGAGAVAVKSESSAIAHGAAHWRELAAQASRPAVSSQQAVDRSATLYQAWVRRPIREGDLLYSCGMHLLGQPDIEITASTHRGDDLAWLDLLALYLLSEKSSRGLSSGDGFRKSPADPPRPLRLTSCERHEDDDFFYNPYGYWRIGR